MKKATTKILLMIGLMLSALQNSNAANFYWVGGSGSWSDFANHWATTSGGSTFHTSIPNLNDDVFFDAQSFTAINQFVQLDSTFYFCKNMDWTGALYMPSIEGMGATLKVYGSLTFIDNMIVNQISFAFSSTQTGVNIDTREKELGYIQFNGSGSFVLQSPLYCSGNIELTDGSLDANGNNIHCNSFTKTVLPVLTTGDITVTIAGTSFSTQPRKFQALGTITGSDLTTVIFDCASGEIEASGSTTVFDSVMFIGAGSVLRISSNYVSMTDNGFVGNSIIQKGIFDKQIILSTSTFDTLSSTNIYLYVNETSTVNNLLDINSDCNNFGTLNSMYPGGISTLNVPSGNVTLNYIQLSGITATGGATFTANNSIDNGNNTGWTITSLTPRKLFWVNGTGNWNDPAHWSLTSGGIPTTCSPTKLDSTIFDANSLTAGDTVYTVNDLATCNNLQISNVAFGPVFSGTFLTVNGSVDIQSAVTWNVNTLKLTGTASTCILGSIAPLNYIDKVGTGNYTATTDLNFEILFLESGTMDFSNRSVNAIGLNSYPLTTVIMTNTLFYTQGFSFMGTQTGSSTAQIQFPTSNAVMASSGTYYSIDFTQDGRIDSNVTANIFKSTGTVHLGNNNSFGRMEVGGDLYLHGQNSTDTLQLNNGGHSIIQDAGRTFTVTNEIFATANCNKMISLRSGTSGAQTNIVKTLSNAVNVDYFDIADINVSGAVFNATNSINSGNNTGWTITSPTARNLYWIGGPGNWSDSTHWALVSGGTGGNCVPTAVDDVYLDQNSGLSGNTLTFDIANPAMNKFDMRTAGTEVTLAPGIPAIVTMYSSAYFAPTTIIQLQNLRMLSSGTAELFTGGSLMDEMEIEMANGTFTLADEFSGTSIHLASGSLDLNGNNITVSNLSSEAGTTVNLGPVTIEVTNFDLKGTNTNTAQTDFNMNVFAPAYYAYGYYFKTQGTFKNITVNAPGCNFSTPSLTCKQFTAYYYAGISGVSSTCTIEKAVFFNDVGLFGNNYFDTLFFNNPGRTVTVYGTQEIGTQLICGGSPGFPVYLNGTNAATFSKTSGDVCISNALLQGITGAGGANFYAGQGCTDLGGNVNWQFTPCLVTSDVWPGDANFDLLCNNFDILNIGVAFNETGPVRGGGNNSWTAQPAADFSSWFSSAVNIKHADSDGNGIVEYADTVAIDQNYSLNHPARLTPPVITTSSHLLPPLSLEATPDTVGPSMAVHIDVLLGTAAVPVDSLYGIAFTVNYDPTVVDTMSVQSSFVGSWLGTVGVDMITFVRHFPTIGKLEVAMVRNDHQNVANGFGDLASFDVVIVDNISTVTNSLFRLTDVTAITYTQLVQPLARVNDTIYVDPTVNKVPVIDLNKYFKVYPNPATSVLNIYSNDIMIQYMDIFDITGKQLVHLKVNGNQASIPVESLPQGIYQLRCISEQGIFNRAIEIVKR